MSVTRLLVLGAVYQFQPVHGYFVRRELLTWHVDEWANIQPGSIYNALRGFVRDGYLEAVGTEASQGRPARTSYRLTDTGHVELLALLREALWSVETFDSRPVMAVLSFMYALSRQEVTAAFEQRVNQLDARILTNDFARDDALRSESTPDYVREIFDLTSARLRGEQAWARELVARLRAGEYSFAGEPGGWPQSGKNLP